MTFRGDPKRILLVRTDRLGETVLNLPVAAALKQAFARAAVTWMANPTLMELVQGAPGVDRVLAYGGEGGGPWWRRAVSLATSWRSEQFDVAVISNATKECHVAAWLAGIPVRVGYDRKWGWLLTHRLEDRRALGERHEVEYNMQLLAALGVTGPTLPVLHLPVSNEAEGRLDRIIQACGLTSRDRIVAVHPWTSNPRKQWPAERFQALVSRLEGLAGVRTVLVGGPETAARAHEVMPLSPSTVINLVGRLSLPELAACLARARLLISNDSGPMHVAAAVGTLVVVLFGTADAGSHPRRWGPWGSGHTVIHKPLEQISVDEVFSAAQRYLS